MATSRSKWLLAVILASVHVGLVVVMFIGVEASPDGEAVLGWFLFDVVDFPSSLAVEKIDHSLWQKEILWYSEDFRVTQFSRLHNLDHLNVGTAILFLPAGTLQWALIGYLVQSACRRWREKRILLAAGEPLPLRCPSCGEVVSPSAEICRNCGSPTF